MQKLNRFYLLVLCCLNIAAIQAQNIVPMIEGYSVSHYSDEDPFPIVNVASELGQLICGSRGAIGFYELRPYIHGNTPGRPPSYHIACTWEHGGGVIHTVPAFDYYTIGWVRICPKGYSPDRINSFCESNSEVNPNLDVDHCTVGNPIAFAIGEKKQKETDIVFPENSGFNITRFYNSGALSGQHANSFGDNWGHTYDRRIAFGSTNGSHNFGLKSWPGYRDDQNKIRRRPYFLFTPNPTDATPTVTPDYAYLIRENGKTLLFYRENSSWVAPSYASDYKLSSLSDGSGWALITDDNQLETYDNFGRLLSLKMITGNELTFHHDLSEAEGGDDFYRTLDRIEDSIGNSVNIIYDDKQRILSIVDSSNKTYSYSYNANGYLAAVTLPDSTSRQYHYEDNRYLNKLTGITDENNIRYVVWAYDEEGRAVSSEHVDGADRVTLDYSQLNNPANSSVTVINPLGKQTTYFFTTINGVRKITQVEGHPSENCAGANKAYTYDANGFLASKTDWKGNTTTYVYNDRGQETSRTEAFGTPEARTITTEWHGNFNLPVRIIEPEREVFISYDDNGRLLSRQILPRS